MTHSPALQTAQAAPCPERPSRIHCPACGHFLAEALALTQGAIRVRCRHCKTGVLFQVAGPRLIVERSAPESILHDSREGRETP